MKTYIIIYIIAISIISLWGGKIYGQFYEPNDTVTYLEIKDTDIILKTETKNKYKFTLLQMSKRYKVKLTHSLINKKDSSVITRHKTKSITFGDAFQLIKFDQLKVTDSNIKNYKYRMIWPFGSITYFDMDGNRIKKKVLTKNGIGEEMYQSSIDSMNKKNKNTP